MKIKKNILKIAEIRKKWKLKKKIKSKKMKIVKK